MRNKLTLLLSCALLTSLCSCQKAEEENVQVRAETARFSQMFGLYQVLAATNQLLPALELAPPTASKTYARERFHVKPTAPAELMERRYPN